MKRLMEKLADMDPSSGLYRLVVVVALLLILLTYVVKCNVDPERNSRPDTLDTITVNQYYLQ